MPRVLAVSSDRADTGLVAPILAALAEKTSIDLHVFLTGAHCGDRPPNIAVPGRTAVHRGGADLGGTSASAAAAMAEILKAAATLCAEVRPDIVLFVGDRLEMLPCATATLPLNLPIAHLHGGELTLGAVDDRVRHAITKLSHVHFAATVAAAERIAAMGEESWRIVVSGGPGLDALLAEPELDAAEFRRLAGLPDNAQFRLVTVHPETNVADPLAPLATVLDALAAAPQPTLVTASNNDPGGAAIRAAFADFAGRHAWVVLRESLGTRLYANAMRHSSVMLGNSSSGIIEAGLFGLSVVNVGGRQDGRERGPNVRDVPADPAAVAAALREMSGKRFPRTASPYGDGRASERIAAWLVDLPGREKLLAKRFEPGRPRLLAPWGPTGVEAAA